MTTLSDQLRYFADQCDLHPEWTAAGIIALKDAEPVAQVFCNTKDNPERHIALLLSASVIEPPDASPFADPVEADAT